MESPVYNQAGKKVGTITLPLKVFGLPWNGDLVHQVMTSFTANARHPIAHTKTRGEVSGTGKKPWQQKGTGRARHGSRRSPIWRTGGITFGPRNERDFSQKFPKKMGLKALFTALSQKAKNGEILFLDALHVEGAKTKEARKVLDVLGTIPHFETLATKKNNNAVLFLPEKDENIVRSFRNLGNMAVSTISHLNIMDILNFKHIIFVEPESCAALLEKKLKGKSSLLKPKT